MNDAPNAFDQSRYIVLVENKAHDIFYIAMLLQRFDYRVCTANTAPQALELVSMALPVLVIADLSLPGMSGIDLLNLLRQDPRTESLPVILIVRERDTVGEKRARNAGAFGYLTKPIKPEDLYRLVQGAVEQMPRSSIRIPTRIPVSVNNVSLECIEGECATVLSEHGVYIRTAKPQDRNAEVSIELTVSNRRISINALVLYSHRHGEGPFSEPGMGLKFTRISSEDREFIREFINSEVTRGLLLPT